VFTSLALSPRSREIAILTIAKTTDCDFVFAQHSPIADAAGVNQAARTAILLLAWQ
jgi:AhpD family alkylhydroperoxidase